MQPIQSIALDQHPFTLTHVHHVVQNVDLSLPKLPPHPLFLNRDPDYKTELAHWTSVSARLTSDVALIYATIKSLRSLVQRIRDSLKEIGNVCAPVYVLPTEILQEIFSLVVDDARPPSTWQARILSGVCSHWRTAALACGYIWTSVDIMPMLNPSKSEYLLWWCARVRNYPIHITLRSPSALRFGKPEVIHAYLIAGLIRLGMIANHVRSIKVIDKYVSDAIRCIGPIPIHFPSLKSVDMRCNLGLRLARIGRDSSRWSVPLLRDITLSMNFRGKSEGLWFLDGLLSPSVQRLTFLEGKLDISQLKEVLASCPNLVELNLNGVEYFRDGESGSAEPGGPFNLESLRGLSITECDPMEALEILAEIVTFTTLNRITLEWIGHERLGTWFRQLVSDSGRFFGVLKREADIHPL